MSYLAGPLSRHLTPEAMFIVPRVSSQDPTGEVMNLLRKGGKGCW